MSEKATTIDGRTETRTVYAVVTGIHNYVFEEGLRDQIVDDEIVGVYESEDAAEEKASKMVDGEYYAYVEEQEVVASDSR